MLEEFMNVMTDEGLKNTDNDELKTEVKNLVEGLEMFSDDPKMLTNAYTDIFTSDNVVYLITRISQNPILSVHFPEFYILNDNGESVINCQQNSPYHRYGVFRHILYTVEYVGKDNLKYSKQDLKILKWTMFLHDIGKPFVKTTNAEGRDSFAGHDDVSVEMAKGILERFNFTEEEKKIILTLIKYHDRYLNEGELTRDNLIFLAQELENKKELFEFLIEVKTADNKAKSIDVYNKFMTVLPKYEEFAKEYFKDIEVHDDENSSIDVEVELDDESIISNDEIIGKNVETEVKQLNVERKNADKKITSEDFEKVYDSIINDEDLIYSYTPIIDIDNNKMFAYEVKIEFETGEDIEKIKTFAKEEGKYEKVNQLLLVNATNNGIKEKKNSQVALMVKIDLGSFMSYNNKNRIYDIMDKDNIIISFENYDESNVVDINKLCKEINKKHGMVSLSNFNRSNFTLKELSNMNANFVEYSIDEKTSEETLNDLIKNCSKDAKKVIIRDIKSEDDLIKAIRCNTSLIQGEYVFNATENQEITDYEVESFVNKNIKKHK